MVGSSRSIVNRNFLAPSVSLASGPVATVLVRRVADRAV